MYKDVTKIAKALTRLDGKAEKINPKAIIKIDRWIRTYSSLMKKLGVAVRKALPLSNTQADVDKTVLDTIKWAESNRMNKHGRITQLYMCRGKRRFLAGKCANYRCA